MFGIKGKTKQRRGPGVGADVPPSPANQRPWDSSSAHNSLPSSAAPSYTLDDYYQGDVGSVTSSQSSKSFSVQDSNKYNGMTERQVEDLFEKMLTRRGIHDQNARAVMLSFPVEKKWLMVSQDMQADATGPPASVKKSNSDIREPDRSTPEFYIKQFLEPDMRGVTPRLVAHLAVSLRTMPLSWVRQFIEARGLQVITNVVGMLNKRDTKTEEDLQMEAEILKCFKSLINNRWGAREVVSNPQCVYHIILSLVSPPIQTRKLVCEILAFLCHVDLPKGQELVLKAMEKLKEHRREYARFDAWLKLLDMTLDGRGRMGSLVGASEDVRKLGTDNHLSDYALSNMMLVNSIISVVEDLEIRVHLRNQMNVSGLQTIMDKMMEFNNEHLRRHISIYKQMSDNDYEEMLEIYNEKILSDMNDPRDVFESILSRVEGTRGYDFLLSALQHLLLIRDEEGTQVRYYQLLDNIITQIVLDRKGLSPEDFSGGFGLSVASLIDKFAEQDQLAAAIAEAKEAKAAYEKAIREKQELEMEINLKGDGLVGQLREKTNSLEDLLRMSRHTIKTLQAKLKDVQEEYKANLAAMNAQLKQMYQVAAAANATDSVASRSDRRMSREEVTNIFDRLRAQAILEGKPSDSDVQNELQSLPRAQGLSDAFKSSLTEQLGSSVPSGFVIPGTMPLIGSTRRGGRGASLTSEEDKSFKQSSATQELGTTTQVSGGQTAEAALAESEEEKHGETSVSELAKELSLKLAKSKESSEQNGAQQSSLQETLAQSSTAEKATTPETSNISSDAAAAASSPPPPPPPPPPPVATLTATHQGEKASSSSQETTSIALPPPPPPPPPPPSSVSSCPSVAAAPAPTTVTPSASTAISGDAGAPPPPPPPPPPPMPPTTMAGAGTAIAQNGVKQDASPIPPPPPPPPPAPPGGAAVAGNAPAAGEAPAPPAPPPPPPPSGPSAPLPPPVPQAPMRKMMRYQPDVKTRALQWTKLHNMALNKTVWVTSDVDEGALEDELQNLGVFASIQEIFAQKIIEPKRRKKVEKKQEICIIDSKKAYSINIAILAKLKHIPFPEVKRRILAVDDKLCTENLLKNLQSYAPTPEEMGKLSVFVSGASEEELEQLSRPDAFCYEVMRIDRYKERIDNMLYRVTFWEKHQQLSRNMTSVLEASIAVKDSKSFKELLKLILVMGNYMNSKTFQGGAFGIKIASINKLVDTKGTEGSTTLLHFLVDTVESKIPRLHNFLDDLKETGQACRVTLQDMVKDYNELRSGLQKLIQELDSHYGEDYEAPEGDNYAKVMHEFREKALEKFEELEVRYTSMDIAYKDAVSFYGENPAEMKPDEFFGIFKTFTSSWERAMNDNKTARKKLEQMEKARKMEEERRERIKAQRNRGVDTSEPSETSSPTDEDKNIMDNLLDRLRAGDLDTNTKRRGDRSATRERRLHRSESVAVMAEDLLKSIQTDEDSPPVPRLRASDRKKLGLQDDL